MGVNFCLRKKGPSSRRCTLGSGGGASGVSNSTERLRGGISDRSNTGEHYGSPGGIAGKGSFQSEVRPKSTRAAWGWRQRDKVSCAWLLAMPGGATALSNAEFSEAAASNLCLPSPACRGRIGELVRGRVFDK